MLSKDVKSLTLEYAAKINEGHMGPRKFWRMHLPRLQYHNPDLQIRVTQRTTIGGPAPLVVEFAGARKETIECQHMHENDIVKALFAMTDAKPVAVNEQDSADANEYIAEQQRLKQAEVAQKAKRAAKREQALLDGPVVA